MKKILSILVCAFALKLCANQVITIDPTGRIVNPVSSISFSGPILANPPAVTNWAPTSGLPYAANGLIYLNTNVLTSAQIQIISMALTNPAAFAPSTVTNLTASQIQIISMALTNPAAFAPSTVTNLTSSQIKIISMALTNPVVFQPANSNLSIYAANGYSGLATGAVMLNQSPTVSQGMTVNGDLYSVNGKLVASSLTVTNSATTTVPFTTTSSTQSAPGTNEFVTAGYINSILAFSQTYYGTTNSAGTNSINTGSPCYFMSPTNVAYSYTRTYASGITNGRYLTGLVITNVSSFSGPLAVTKNIFVTNQNINSTLSMSYELYYSTNQQVTNLVDPGWSSGQFPVVCDQTTNTYTALINVPFTQLPQNSWLVLFSKLYNVSGINSISLLGGSNRPSTVTLNASYSALNGTYQPRSSALDALSNNNGGSLTNISGTSVNGLPPTNQIVTQAILASSTNKFLYTNDPTWIILKQSGLTNTASGVTLSGSFSGNGGGLTNLSSAALTTVSSYVSGSISVDFSQSELIVTNNTTFSGAVNLPALPQVRYTGVTVIGTNTVTWPQGWSPNGTNSVTLTNGVIAFKAVGNSVFAAYYQP